MLMAKPENRMELFSILEEDMLKLGGALPEDIIQAVKDINFSPLNTDD